MSAVTTHNAESPGPFLTQAVLAPPGSTLYVSGQCAVDPKTGKCVEGTVADRTTQVLKNLAEVLKAGGMDLGDGASLRRRRNSSRLTFVRLLAASLARTRPPVVMVNVYLTNHAEDMEPMNEAYMRAFEGFSSPMPARTCVGGTPCPASLARFSLAHASPSASVPPPSGHGRRDLLCASRPSEAEIARPVLTTNSFPAQVAVKRPAA